MDHEPASGNAALWRSATLRLARQINLAWWLSGWLPLAAVIGLTGMVAMLYARWHSADAANGVWCVIAIGFVVAGAAAWWRMRGRFESESSARVRLEDSLGLHARLTAASAGVGEWPPIQSTADRRWPVTWQWRQPVAAFSFITAMLALAAWVPIVGAGASRKYVIEKPTDARMVEQWIDQLRREEIIDEHAADAVERKISELTERPADEWYEHATLEAAGTLREQTAAEMREMAENVAAAEQAAAALRSMEKSLPAPLRDAMVKDLAAAIRAVELGALKPAGDLARLFRELSPADLGQLTPEQIAAIARRLAAHRRALMAALARCDGFDPGDVEGWCDECSGCKPCGECKNCRDGKSCGKTCSKCGGRLGARSGRGGVNRGRCDARLSFGERNELGTTGLEKIPQAIDAARAAPDDVLAVVDGEHDVDEQAYGGPRAGGGIASDGDGGAAVHMDSLLPAEQSAVKRFFEERSER